MVPRYRVSQFASLAGVTVRALQHYDRLGLLTPLRTEAGHRVYTSADHRCVRHILALRAIGMSLRQIADLLHGPPSRLPQAFRAQRLKLELSRSGIDEAIRMLEGLEERTDSSDESLLDRLAVAVERQDTLDAMRGYFSDDAWAKWGERYFYDWPSSAWRALFRSIGSALGEPPESDRAQALLAQAITLWNADIGSDANLARAVREGYGKAWHARGRWPRELQRRYAEYKIEEVARFLGAASWASWRHRGMVDTYTTAGRSIA